jgi:hypothetical protein
MAVLRAASRGRVRKLDPARVAKVNDDVEEEPTS